MFWTFLNYGKKLIRKFWNEEEFKVLLDEISKKNIKNDKFAERVYSSI